MKILLTGANGYIGLRLLPLLLEQGHSVVCLVRDQRRFPLTEFETDSGNRIEVVEGDLLDRNSLDSIPRDIDAAYYLVHSMGSGNKNFPGLEETSAQNFSAALKTTSASQIIYLSGIVNGEEAELSPHLSSRLKVEKVLQSGSIPVTVLRASIIVGAGSASFEIIRDLVEKLPVMIAPKWLRTRCQPVAIRNVLDYLTAVLDKKETFNEVFDIGGPEVLTYEEILMTYARVRNLKRFVVPVPFLTPRLSSYWLYFVTTTSYPLARSLVDSLTHDTSCSENQIRSLIDLDLLTFDEAVERAFSMISSNQVPSSWIDSFASGKLAPRVFEKVEVPQHGVYLDKKTIPFHRDPDEVRRNFWRIGGKNGWYSVDWAWKLRGWMDRFVGGSGLRRGRRHPTELRPGDALDFWRVLIADKEQRRLLLFAEMKLPGEAWLEFTIRKSAEETTIEKYADKSNDGDGVDGVKEDDAPWVLNQTATYRPRGLFGRLYWYAVLPLHYFVFRTMARKIVER